jgi:hypothetical protein
MAQVSTLISCDAAVFTRGLWSFVNIFEELSFAKFPASHPGWDVVICLSDLRGSREAIVEAEIVAFQPELDDALNAGVWSDSAGIELTPQLSREWLRFRTGEVTLRHAGLHEVRVFVDGKLLQVGTILIREAPQ